MSLYINGKWTEGLGADLVSTSPATGDVCWQGNSANEKDIVCAYEAANHALTQWSMLSVDERLVYIKQYTTILEKEKKALAEIIALECGKPLWEALTEVSAMINKTAISVKAYHERTGIKETIIADAKSITRHKAHGVVAVLGPFNFPGHLPNGHIVPALLAGNTVIFKPSELTPMVAERMMQCWQKAGLPSGVLNLVQGAKETGKALLSQDIQAVLFTGSYQTGTLIHQQFGARPEVLVALEMGGNNPLIVVDVKNINAACYHTIWSAFITSGQRCTCARRLIVPRGDEGDNFLSLSIEKTKKLRVGPHSQSPEPFMGPVISATSAVALMNKQKQLLAVGGEALIKMTHENKETGLLTPGIIDVSLCDSLPDEEAFGPLLQVLRVDNFDEAISVANNTRYGLSAGLLSDNADLYKPFYAHIRAGIVNINRPLTGAASVAPFGGVGLSGNHRPSAYYAADYCAYPVASLEAETLTLPDTLSPGMHFND